MTNEEAIKQLLDAEHCLAGHGDLWDVDMEAFEAAIKALKQQSCEDCISRAGALRHRRIIYDDDGIGYNVVSVDEIEKLPSVTPKYTDEEIDKAQAIEQAYISKIVELTVEELKRPKGEWISKPLVYGVTYCSECDFELKINNTNYCPNCGAKMTESEDKE